MHKFQIGAETDLDALGTELAEALKIEIMKHIRGIRDKYGDEAVAVTLRGDFNISVDSNPSLN